MKIRVKYTKTGLMKYIGHLDMLRYFQKAIRRAGLPIAYSQGFSPHQLISFAAPLALGMTSGGEYFDAEFHSLVSSEELVRRLNAQMAEGVEVKDAVLLFEHAKKAMSVVAASDYEITMTAQAAPDSRQTFFAAASHMLEKQSIFVQKQSKKGEKTEDIRKGIYKLQIADDGSSERLYLLLSAGSVYHLKPELVLRAVCQEADIVYQPFAYQIHRLETYMENDRGDLVSLLEAGSRIEETCA